MQIPTSGNATLTDKGEFSYKNLHVHLVRCQSPAGSTQHPLRAHAPLWCLHPCSIAKDTEDKRSAATWPLPDVFSELFALLVVEEPLPPPASVQLLQDLHHLFQLPWGDSKSEQGSYWKLGTVGPSRLCHGELGAHSLFGIPSQCLKTHFCRFIPLILNRVKCETCSTTAHLQEERGSVFSSH